MAEPSQSPSPTPVVGTLSPAYGALILLFCLAALGVLLIAIADPWGRMETKIGTSSSQPVVFVLSPSHAPADTAAMKALGDFLTKQTGFAVEVRAAASPVAGIDAFAGTAGTADVGLLSLFEYLLARAEHGVEAGLQVLRKDGASSFTGVLVVRSDVRTQKVAELARARIAFVNEYSTSGFVFPMKLFADEKVEVEVFTAGSHPKVLDALRSNTAAAGTTYADAVAGKPEFRVIAETPPIPNEPIFFRKGFDKGKRESLCAALAYLATAPEHKSLLRNFADVTGVRRITDGHYQEVLGTVAAAGKTIYDVVPEGVSLEARRRYLELSPR